MACVEWSMNDAVCVCVALLKVVAKYTEVTGADWEDDERCSTCSSSSSDSEFDYYLDRRLRPMTAVNHSTRVRHVGEDFIYASGSGRLSGGPPAQCVRSPSAGRIIASGWPRDIRRGGGRHRRKQTGKRCVVS